MKIRDRRSEVSDALTRLRDVRRQVEAREKPGAAPPPPAVVLCDVIETLDTVPGRAQE